MGYVNDAVRFVIELCALVGFAVGASHLVDGPAGWALAVVVVLAAVGYWGVLVAPKSRRRLRDPARLAAEEVFFALATVGFVLAGWVVVGVVFAVVAVVSSLLVRVISGPGFASLTPAEEPDHR